jgi:hypothetical protein
LLPEEGVDERRLADARRPEDDGRATVREVVRKVAEVVAGQRAEDDDRHAGRDRRDRHEAALQIDRDIGLVEDDDGLDPARPGDGQVALETSHVEIVVEAGDDERDVDVGRDHLLVDEVAGRPPAGVRRAPPERRATRQHGRDDRRVVGSGRGVGGFEHHPVPDGRVIRRGECFEAETAGHAGRPVHAVRAPDDGRLLVDRDDPRWFASILLGGREPLVPADRHRRVRHAYPTRLSLPVRLA